MLTTQTDPAAVSPNRSNEEHSDNGPWSNRARETIGAELGKVTQHVRERVRDARQQTAQELGKVGERVDAIMKTSSTYVRELKAVLEDVTGGAAMARIAEPHARQSEAIQRYIDTFESQSNRSKELIQEALDKCREIRQSRAGIGAVSTLSNILRLSAKVETVYLGNGCGEFEDLAEEMKHLNIDVQDVSQSIDGLVGELETLMADLSAQSERMQARTQAFAQEFAVCLQRVQQETERLQESGMQTDVIGDQRVHRVQELARNAKTELGFTPELNRRLDCLERSFDQLCAGVVSTTGANVRIAPTGPAASHPAQPAPTSDQPPSAPPVEATAQEDEGMGEGDFLMF